MVKIQCQYCDAHACRGCHQASILSSYEDPHCIECKRGWSTEFMAATFSHAFRNTTLRLHRRKVLFEREKALLPALQVYVEYRREYEKAREGMNAVYEELGNEHDQRPSNKEKIAFQWATAKAGLDRLYKELAVERQEITRIKALMADEAVKNNAEILASYTIRLKETRKARDALKKNIDEKGTAFKEIHEAYSAKRALLNDLRNQFWTARQRYDDTTGSAAPARREFIMKCPAADCRGFLSTAYKCGTCEARTCKDCLVCLGTGDATEHTCAPDMVESAKTIRAETQPCPKCGTRIFKTEGCDQMWCVMEGCGTAFSWNTGHIVTGVIHNPHYYEWLRRQGGGAAPREAGDIPCGGMPTTWQFVNALQRIDIPNELKTIIMETFRNMQELIAMRLRDYPARMPQLMNKEMDVDYLMNKLTEDEWKRGLEMAETAFNRKKEIGQILQTLATAGSDMMNRLYEKAIEMDAEVDIDNFVGWILDVAMPEFDQLRSFGNESLKGLSKRDRMAVPQFGEVWAWTRSRALYIVKKKVAATATALGTQEVMAVS